MINLKVIWQFAGRSIGIGALVGAGLGAWAGSRFFGGGGAVAGLLLGALLGATTGLDLTLVPLPAAGSRRSQPPPPFTTVMVLVLVGIGGGLLALYAWGSVILTCQRSPVGQVDCRRVTTVWMGWVEDNSILFSGVSRARQAASDLVLLTTAESAPGFLYGLPPDTAGQITRFLDSKEAALRIEYNTLWFFPLIFAVVGIALLPLSIPAFRSARQKLAEKLDRDKRRYKKQT